MVQKVFIDDLAEVINESLVEYAGLTSEMMKKTVCKAANTIKNEIQAKAPRDTGNYAKSWAVKKVLEKSDQIQFVVHSKNRYQLVHLIEFGHAKRNGGRVAGKVHITPAEQVGIKQLEEDLARNLENV